MLSGRSGGCHQYSKETYSLDWVRWYLRRLDFLVLEHVFDGVRSNRMRLCQDRIDPSLRGPSSVDRLPKLDVTPGRTRTRTHNLSAGNWLVWYDTVAPQPALVPGAPRCHQSAINNMVLTDESVGTKFVLDST